MDVTERIQLMLDNVEQVIIGKTRVIQLALSAMLAQGHILFEDVPGTGKTILARSLAISIGSSFSRIQFTPDLLPSDVTGVSIFNQQTGEFEFREGPILSQVVLADEINRATPRTQSSLLEAMAEGQVTVEGVSRSLPDPFIVMATQNPIESEGTFPLPEAQLDRFLIKIKMGYPEAGVESRIMEEQQHRHPIEDLEPVISAKEFVEMQEQIKNIYVKPELRDYIVDIVQTTRSHQHLQLGASPRGSLGIFRMSRSLAALKGRDYVIPDDIKEVAPAVLNHRLLLRADSSLRGQDEFKIIEGILKKVEVPLEVE